MISLTVPVYNEREALGPLFEKVQAVMHRDFPGKWEIIFVNDGTSVATLARRLP
jgi:glycosyltransferase involved in cell wall biosynthesis